MDRHTVICNLRLVHLRPLTIYLALEDWELDQHTVLICRSTCMSILVMTKGQITGIQRDQVLYYAENMLIGQQKPFNVVTLESGT